MKKMIALCMAMLMTMAMLTACTAADPNHPYGDKPPAPMNGETSAVLVHTEQA